MPEPPLPQVPGSGAGPVARRPSVRVTAYALLPRGVHTPGRAWPCRFTEPTGGLRHPLACHGGDVTPDRCRPQTSGRRDWLPGGVAYLGTEPAPAPARP